MSLARLWCAGGRKGEGLELLSGVHARFSEGFGTRDLVEARGLLEALES